MVAPLVVAGSVAKLALAVALTHRTRWWWAPGAGMLAIGAGLISTPVFGYGFIAMVLGLVALAVATVLRPAL